MEVPVVSERVGNRISSDEVHPDLLPYRNKNHDTRREFRRVGPDMHSNRYIFHFDKPIPATSTMLQHHCYDKMIKNTMPQPMVAKDMKIFIVPRNFLQDISVVESSEQLNKPPLRLYYIEEVSSLMWSDTKRESGHGGS